MFLPALESSLNRNIAASSATRALCTRLQGKSMRVQLTGWPQQFMLHAHADRLQLSDKVEGQADASLSGSPLGLLNLATQRTTTSLSGNSVRIEGDAEVAQAFSELLKQAKPDLEEELSRIVGDVAAHQVGATVRSVLGFARRVGDTLLQNTGEYLTEESRNIPNRTEADEFNAGVDQLRDDVARFEARLNVLLRKRPQ